MIWTIFVVVSLIDGTAKIERYDSVTDPIHLEYKSLDDCNQKAREYDGIARSMIGHNTICKRQDRGRTAKREIAMVNDGKICYKDFGVADGNSLLDGCVAQMNAWVAEAHVEVISIETLRPSSFQLQNKIGTVRVWYRG